MNEYIKLAIEQAKIGITNRDGGPFGAVIVYKNKVIAKAHNTVIKDNDPTCHAEMNAIRKAAKYLKNFNLKGCSIYISAQPCPMCVAAIAWARITNVYYGCDYRDSKNIGFDDHEIHTLLTNPNKSAIKIKFQQIDRDACLKLFKEYKKLPHKLY